jgi:signal peptidase II
LSIAIIVIDQLTKTYILGKMIPGESIRWLPFFNITLAFNPGAAFSFLGNASGWQMPLISVIVIVVSTVLLVWLSKLQRNEYMLCIAVSLIIGGAIGNLIDRLRLSYVIDFFDFHIGSWHFATFNVADAAITVGAILLLIKFFFLTKKD